MISLSSHSRKRTTLMDYLRTAMMKGFRSREEIASNLNHHSQQSQQLPFIQRNANKQHLPHK